MDFLRRTLREEHFNLLRTLSIKEKRNDRIFLLQSEIRTGTFRETVLNKKMSSGAKGTSQLIKSF